MSTSSTTLTGKLLDSNALPLAFKSISFRLTSVGVDTATLPRETFPRDIVRIKADAAGEFSVDLWVNGDSQVESIYEVGMPDGQLLKVIVPQAANGGIIDLATLIAEHQVDGSIVQDISVLDSAKQYTNELATDPTINGQFNSVNWYAALGIDAFAVIASPTFTGTVTIPIAAITTANITTANITTANITTADFNGGATGGKLSWNNQEKTLNLATGSGAGADEVVIQVGQEVVLYAKNKSNVNMTNGQVVLVSGTSGQEPSIELAQADTLANARRAIGVITQDIDDDASGFVTLIGKVRGLELDENTFSLGEVVYLSSTVAGGITTVQPDISVEIGHVVSTSNGNNKQGVLEVQLNNEAAVHELEQTVPHNTDSVVICNDGDNIQDKYDEAALLTGNTKTLIVMAGTYGNVEFTDANFFPAVNIIGIGNPTLGSIIDNTTFLSTTATYKNFTCNSVYLNIAEGNIENITTTSSFYVYRVLSLATIKDIKTGTNFGIYENNGTIKDITCGTVFRTDIGANYGTIKNVTAATVNVEDNYGTVDNVNATNDWVHLGNGNTGTIKNCSGDPFLQDLYNSGIIDNCHSTGTDRGFGGYLGSHNSGTIKNCTAKGALSFGQQYADGVTENCVCGGIRAFAGASNNIDFTSGGIEGTYKNCKGGNESFFGRNTKTDAVVEMEATYENCTGGDKSFGFVESAPASGSVLPKTVFAGTAKNCTGGSLSFASSYVAGAQAEIKDGAVIENCTAKNNSFATNTDSTINTTCINYGNVIRSRCTGPSGFSATATGKVRLCLDANFNEVNLP